MHVQAVLPVSILQALTAARQWQKEWDAHVFIKVYLQHLSC